MGPHSLIFRVHAVQRMFQRGISEEEVRPIVDAGEVIEAYPEDRPDPGRLILGYAGDRPLHVIAADSAEAQETVIITVYEPDPARWDPSFRQRRSP